MSRPGRKRGQQINRESTKEHKRAQKTKEIEASYIARAYTS
jgi:hypothetical protein